MFKLCRTICELNNNNVGYKTNINRPIYGYNSWDLIWDIDGSYIPSGYLTVRHGKSPFFIGKPSINGPFSMAMFMLNNQRVTNRYLDLKRTNNMLDKLCCHWDKLPLGFLVGQNSGDILRIQPTDLI